MKNSHPLFPLKRRLLKMTKLGIFSNREHVEESVYTNNYVKMLTESISSRFPFRAEINESLGILWGPRAHLPRKPDKKSKHEVY